MNNNLLQNKDSYKKSFECNINDICITYLNIVLEYVIHFSETNKSNYKITFIKGIETITHVFKILLLNTKNIQLTYFFCQKSIYYYIEFITQIESENINNFQLNLQTASFFVYKKTIYMIYPEYNKLLDSGSDKEIINIMNNFLKVHSCIIYKIIDTFNISSVTILDLIKTHLEPVMMPLISLIKNTKKINREYINKILITFIDSFQNSDKNICIYLNLLIKKLVKQSIYDDRIIYKILNISHFKENTNLEPVKYINLIIA
jgi:hypothetical protein